MRAAWGSWLTAFFWVAAVATATTVVMGDAGALSAAAFFLRGFEPFALAYVVCRLYVDSVPYARRWVLRFIHLVILVNVIWVLYQLAFGVNRTLFPAPESGGSDGVRLVGEASAFGAGMFFAFVAVLGVCEYRSRIRSRRFALGILAVGAAGTFLTQSRVASAVAVLAVAALIARSRWGRSSTVLRAVAIVAAGGIAGFLLIGELRGRLEPQAIAYSLTQVRGVRIWRPLLERALDSPILGAGPGELVSSTNFLGEAHNVLLRMWLDYGLVALCVGVGLFLRLWRMAWRVARLPGTSEWLTTYASATYLFLGAIAVAGIVQDSLTAVMTGHLLAMTLGLFAGEWSVGAHGRVHPVGQSSDRQARRRPRNGDRQEGAGPWARGGLACR
jgi:hypothetical protein